MDILSLFAGASSAQVSTTENQDESKKDSPLDAKALDNTFAKLVSKEEAAAAAQEAVEKIDGLYGQQVSAQLFTLLAQQGGGEDEVFTREEAELWVAEILESEELEIDLSLLDREKIIQILLGIEEDPLKEAEASEEPEEITADSDAEDILQAQQLIMDKNDTVDFGNEETALEADLSLQAANDNVAAYVESQAVVKDVMLVTPAVTVVVSNLGAGKSVAGAAIQQALAKAQRAFDEFAQVIPPKQSALFSDGALDAEGEFSAVALLEGAYVPAAEGNTALQHVQQVAQQTGGDIPTIDRNAALVNVGVRSDGDKRNANANVRAGVDANTETKTVVTAETTNSITQSTIAAPKVEETAAAEHAKANAQAHVQQQQAANSQSHSANSWAENAHGSDRAYTVRPGAHIGGAADQVKFSIQNGIDSGIDRMVIQLDPADLGRVEIRMEVQDGRAHVVVTADKNDTLNLLQRDSRGLEQALAQAGIEADAGAMDFQLGGQENSGAEGDEYATGTGFADEALDEDNEAIIEAGATYTLNIEEGLNITV